MFKKRKGDTRQAATYGRLHPFLARPVPLAIGNHKKRDFTVDAACVAPLQFGHQHGLSFAIMKYVWRWSQTSLKVEGNDGANRWQNLFLHFCNSTDTNGTARICPAYFTLRRSQGV